jgi:hypothetical protein
MQGRAFLDQARDSLPGTKPRQRRAAIIHAYYALLLECREAMIRWGLPTLQRLQVHSQVRLRLIYSTDAELNDIGHLLERMGQHRNDASYNLSNLPIFDTPVAATDHIQKAADAIARLDAIDADPVRRAVAIASIRP